MKTLDHISPSMLTQFKNCPWCWVKKYLYGIPFPSFQYFEDGKEWHREVDRYHRGLEYDQELIAAYTQKYKPDYRKQSEVRFKKFLEYDGWRSELPMVGIIDGIGTDDVIGDIICDLKYAQSAPATTKNIQSISYSWIYYMKKGTFPTFIFNWVNKKNGRIKNVAVVHTEEDLRWLRGEIEFFFDAINNPVDIIKAMPRQSFMPSHYDDCPNL